MKPGIDTKVRLGVRVKLFSLFLVTSLFPLFIISGIAYEKGKNANEFNIISHLNSIADIKEQELENWLIEKIKDLEVFSENDTLVEIPGGEDCGQSAVQPDLAAKLHHQLNSMMKDEGDEHLFVTDYCGRIIASNRLSEIGSRPDFEEIATAIRTREIVVKDIFLSVKGRPHMLFIVPILDRGRFGRTAGEVIGAAVLEIDVTSAVYPMIGRWPNMGASGETLLVRREGPDVLFLSELRFMKNAALKHRIPLSSKLARPAINAVDGDEGILRTIDYRGVDVLSAYRHIPVMDWGFVAKIDQREAFASINRLKRQLTLFVLISFLVVVVLAFWFSRTITAPILYLERLTRKVAAGDFSERPVVETRDEIGLLAQSFGVMEAELEKHGLSLQMFADIAINAQQDTFFLFDPHSGKVIRWNRAFNEITGYTDEEIASMEALDPYYSEEDLERIREFIQEVLEKGMGTIEATLLCKDGGKAPTEYAVSVVRNEDGNPDYFVTVGRDIRERKRREEELRLQSEIIHRMSEGVFLCRMDNGVIVYTNPKFEEMFGYDPGEMIGEHVSIVNYPTEKSPEKTAREILEFVEDNDVWQGEIKNIKKDGSPFWCFTSVSVFSHSIHGKVIVSVQTDITERKQAEEKVKQYSENLESMVVERTGELKKAQKELVRQEKLAAIGKLSGSVAHDIRNPLGAISNSIYYLDLISNEETDDKIREHISIMAHEINRANDIINDLMDFSRENAPSLSKGDLNRIPRQVLNGFDFPDDIAIDLTLDEGLPIIAFDHSQMTRVFHNLINNARQAMPAGGVLRIRTGHGDESVRIAVSDTGHGIAEEALDNIFEPLFTTRAKGVGLGLSIVKDFVEKHGGAIDVESELGKGTTFTVRLPVIRKSVESGKRENVNAGKR